MTADLYAEEGYKTLAMNYNNYLDCLTKDFSTCRTVSVTYFLCCFIIKFLGYTKQLFSHPFHYKTFLCPYQDILSYIDLSFYRSLKMFQFKMFHCPYLHLALIFFTVSVFSF